MMYHVRGDDGNEEWEGGETTRSCQIDILGLVMQDSQAPGREPAPPGTQCRYPLSKEGLWSGEGTGVLQRWDW